MYIYIHTHVHNAKSPSSWAEMLSVCPVWTPVSTVIGMFEPSGCSIPSVAGADCHTHRAFLDFPTLSSLDPTLTFGSFPKHPIVSCAIPKCTSLASHKVSHNLRQWHLQSKGHYLGFLPCLCLYGSFLWVRRQPFINKLTFSSFNRDWSRSSNFWETEIPRAKCSFLSK